MRLAFLSIGRHIHTERWIQWFAQRGHECHLLTVQPGEIAGVTVHDIRTISKPKPLHYALSLLKVRKLLKEIQPDLLNTHFLTGYGYWGHFSGLHPNVLTVWGDDIYTTPYESSLKYKLAELAVSSCDAITGDSTDILEQACRDFGATPEKSFRVLWGVDFERFKPGITSEWRGEIGFDDDDIVFFSPRSFTQPYYNIDTVIEAASIVAKKEPRAKFLFAGYEGDPDPFWAMAKKAGISKVSHFLGRIPHEKFASYLAGSDVFISVPSVDATAVSLLEAMSCATAIIVSNLPSSIEWVEDKHSALVVEPRNAKELADSMLKYAEDASLRKLYGERAMAYAHKVAGFNENMENVNKIFTSLIDDVDQLPLDVSLMKCSEPNVD